jgi:6-phosphofructokinase
VGVDSSITSTMKLAVLTSGGDSAGMNAVVRAVVKAGILKYVPFHFPMGDASFNAGAHGFTEDVKHGSFEKDMKASFAET